MTILLFSKLQAIEDYSIDTKDEVLEKLVNISKIPMRQINGQRNFYKQ